MDLSRSSSSDDDRSSGRGIHRQLVPTTSLLLNGVACIYPSSVSHFEMNDVAEFELFELGQRPAAPASGLSMYEVRLLRVEFTELLGVVIGVVVDVQSTLQVA